MITKSRRLSEFLGLLSFGLALMLLTSLATFDPADPAVFFKAGHGGPARNFIGPLGAFLAELLIPQLFGFAAGRTVADGDQVHGVLLHQVSNAALGFVPLALRRVRVNGGVVEEIAVLVQDRQLATDAETRIDGQHPLLPQRPLDQ